MSNQFVNLPVPSSNASGAAVDVSRMGATKTITVGGPFQGTVTIEYATDDTGTLWAPVPNGSFVNQPGRVTIDLAAHFMRAVMAAYKGGAANADVGSSGAGSAFIQLGVAAVDVSALPRLKTVVVSGACNIEISEDGNSWSQAFSFQNKGGQTGIVYAQFARVTGGATAWMGGAEEGDVDGSPAFALSTTIIYARPVADGGSDTSGNGSLMAPYLTFQRAIRDVPLQPAPGARYVVDITGIGTEVLPDYYVLPNIQFPTIDYTNDLTIPYFYSGAGLRIRALPKLVALPGTEAVIPAGSGVTIAEDADTKLITLSVPTQITSWTTGNLRNKKLIRTVGTHKAGCVILAATNAPGLSTLTLTNSAENFNAGVIGALTPDEELQIVEPSAGLEGGAAPRIDFPNEFGFAGIVSNVNSIAFQGIDVSNRAGEVALGVLNCPNLPLELCNIAGFSGQGPTGSYWVYANGTLLSYGLVSVNSSFFSSACHFDSAPAGFPFFFYMVNGTPQSFSDSAFSDCDTYTPGEQNGLHIICNTAFQNVLMNGGGILVGDGRAVLDHVQINNVVATAFNPGGDGVVMKEAGFGKFVHVTGTGIAGYGAVIDSGSQLLVDLTTTIGNDGPRAYTNGLAPGTPVLVPTWPVVATNDANATTFSRVAAS